MPNSRFKRNTLSVSIGLALLCGPAAIGYAADEGDADKDNAEMRVPAKLETISVTADWSDGFQVQSAQVGAFRDANLLDIPMTVQVIPRAVLDAQNATGLFDALKNTAGVTRSQVNASTSDNLQIRGINVENRTNYRLNGSLPINNLVDMPLENKERVEALKGSSALYYGFTSPAGIVNLVTKRAQLEPILAMSISGNEYGSVIGHIDAGRKFGDEGQYGIRVNAVEGRLRNAVDDVEGNRSLFSLAADWTATDSLGFRFDYENIHKEITEQAAIFLPAAVNGKITLPRLPDPTKLLSGKWAKNDASAENMLLRVDYAFSDNWAGTLEAGRAETTRGRNFTRIQNYNLTTGQGQARVSAGLDDVEYLNKNYRAELAGRVEFLLDHELTLGFMENQRWSNAANTQTITVAQNLYNPVVIPSINVTFRPLYSPVDIVDKGIYAFDRIRINDEWQVLLGVRRSNYSNDTTARTASASTGLQNSMTKSEYDVKKTSPSYGVIYKPRPDTSIYATYIQGLEETGVAPIGTANQYQALPPAVSKQKELGFRTEAIEGVTLSAGYFDIERQSAFTDLATNTFVLAGKARFRGIEYSANGEIGQDLSVYLSGLFLDAKQEEAADPRVEGNIPENTAKRTVSLFTEYRLPMLEGLSFNAGAYYIGRRAVDALNQAYIPGYTTYTFGTRYQTRYLGGHRTTFQVNVDNLTDKRYWAATGGGYIAESLPRTISFLVKFEM